MTPVIHVVTPCMNMHGSIDRTILSVITQAGDLCIRYHVQDGGSSDGTVERLNWWEREITSGRFPIQCENVDFTWSSDVDDGMYGAIIDGFARLGAGSDDWLTWINADDILMPGAFAFIANVERQFAPSQVSWVGGAACVANNGHPMMSYDRVLPVQAIREGLCDGTHWDFFQQEGTFFRKWLWESAQPDQTIRSMKLAGDWNLWRLLAKQATLVQWPLPLGCFTITPGQLSAKQRSVYEHEMDEVVDRATRSDALRAMGQTGRVVRRRMHSRYPDGQLSIIDEELTHPLAERVRRVFGAEVTAPATKRADKTLYVGAPLSDRTASPSFSECVRESGGVFAYDHGWQFPAVTEQHAYHRVRDAITVPDGITYVAYPWATLIDKLHSGAKDARLALRRFREFCALLPKDTIRVTVCQQIYMRRFMDLFAEAGIDHIFWSHATNDDAANAAAGREHPAVHPFPLYPVQVTDAMPEAGPDADEHARPHLFSFVGARADKHYPRQTRNFILDLLADDPRGFVSGRTNWFYEKIVYHHQVHNMSGGVSPEGLIEQEQAAQFRSVLKDSTFSLCPAGTGPNSIRLWESIGAGAIPVILADDWAPPGNRALWEAACVIRPETEVAVAALPDELASLAASAEVLAAKRQALRQLWLLYGPDGFVHDIHELFQSLAGGAKRTNDVDRSPEQVEQAQILLTELAGAMLVDPAKADQLRNPHDPLARDAASAMAVLRPADQVRKQFEAVAARSGVPFAPVDGAPAIARSRVPKVCYFGRHSNRTPLSYEPFLREIRGCLDIVDRPEDADLVLSGFNLDFRDAASQLVALRSAKPDLKLMILSEEPLWDVYWSGGFIEADRKLDNGVEYRFLNHANCAIFDFDRVPYFSLTDDSYPAVYASRIAAMSRLTPGELLEHWATAPISAAFFAEHRTSEGREPAFADREIWGMSAHRTAIADAVRKQMAGTLCCGKGWGDAIRRQDLPSWHLDKLATLAGRTRLCSAIENTHQNRYITEKLFDAFAVGAIPIYAAGDHHRALEFVPQGAMLNIVGLDPETAAQRILEFRPDAAFAEAWLDAAHRLAGLFGDVGTLWAERQRFARASLDAVHELLQD